MLTVGPRGAGKTTFCTAAMQQDPTLTLIERDAILMDRFGTTMLNSYSGGHEEAAGIMWSAVEHHLRDPHAKPLLLDTWCGDSRVRKIIIDRLRSMGADRVIAWYFVTSLETVDDWFWQKPGIAKSGSPQEGKPGFATFPAWATAHDHMKYHALASDIDDDGFDAVFRIDPLTTTPTEALRV